MPDDVYAYRSPLLHTVDNSPQTRLCMKDFCAYRVWWLVWTWRTWGSAAAPTPSSLSPSARQTSRRASSNMSRHAQPCQHLVLVQTFSMHTHIHSVKAGCQAEVCHRLWVQTNVNGSISHTSIAQCQWLVTSVGLRLLPVALLATSK